MSYTIVSGLRRSATIERASDPRTRQRAIDLGAKPFAGELVLHVEDPEAPAGLKHVRHEVEHPNLVRPARLPQRRPRADCTLAATPAAYRQAFLAVEQVDLLQIHPPFLALGHLARPAADRQSALRALEDYNLHGRTALRWNCRALGARRSDERRSLPGLCRTGLGPNAPPASIRQDRASSRTIAMIAPRAMLNPQRDSSPSNSRECI